MQLGRTFQYFLVGIAALSLLIAGYFALGPAHAPWVLALANVIALSACAAAILYIVGKRESSSSARLAAIVQSSDDIIVSKNLDGIITSWNQAAEHILGFTAEEAIGRHISMIIPKDRMSEENDIISSIRAGRRVSHFETIRHKKDGSPIELSITVSPVKDKWGKIVGASKIARDITGRKAQEAALVEERQTLETLNNLTPKIASTLDLKTLVQSVTDEATQLIGANFGAFFYNVFNEEGKAFQLFTLAGAPREAFEKLGMPRETKLFVPTFQGQGSVLSDDILNDPRYGHSGGMPNGHLPVRSYLASPVVSRSGEIIGGLFFGHREAGIFTERDMRLVEGIAALAAVGIDNARLYDQVITNQAKAEEASAAKSDFLATMSHEIRTPMNAIVGIAHILETSATPAQKNYVSTLRSAADSLLILINDLLDISRIESQEFGLETEPFEPARLCEDVHNLLNVKANEKGISFVVETDAVKNAVFKGDAIRLRQIVNNLCGNAIKFTEKGGVLLRAAMENSGAQKAQLIITVRDTGIGIADNKKDLIFEKFVQADTSINRKYGGTGLGLSITKSLVDAMGGTISVESTPNKGSTFTVRIPMIYLEDIPEAQAKNGEADAKEQPSSGAKILLVEDYEPNVVVATAFLDMFGYSYDIAKNGLEATDKVRHASYDALLMDLQMPGMNGFEATKAIRALGSKAANVSIIGMTAHAMAGDREKCLEAGMNDYISKPFKPEDLQEKLAQAVSHTRKSA